MKNSKYYLGIDLGGTKTAVSLLQENKIIDRISFTSPANEPPEEMLELIESNKRKLVNKSIQISSVGVSVGAAFNPQTGTIIYSPHLKKWNNYPLVKNLQERMGLPIFADNDANACALAEWKYGAGRGSKNMAFLTFGTGLGAGLILNQQLHRGSHFLAGEVGSIRVAKDGPNIRNKPGCLEGFSSGAGIAARAEQRYKTYNKQTLYQLGDSTKNIAKLAREGDLFCLEIFQESGHYLGAGIAILKDILDLDTIVIGSIYLRCEELLNETMNKVINTDSMSTHCQILPAELGESIGDYAAMALAINGESSI
ncbi:MAG: ROK family protein [Lentisphaeraceae bacterium]|nr:ROK family protein [Lentisphaeraceae bacterium]